jgi:hypothetical protein
MYKNNKKKKSERENKCTLTDQLMPLHLIDNNSHFYICYMFFTFSKQINQKSSKR